MPDDADRLEPILRDVVMLLQEAVRGIRALETRIDALPGPAEIGSAIGHDVREAMGEEREAVGGRLRSITDDVTFIVGRLEEIGQSLMPIEGLRTEVASVVDRARTMTEVPPALAGLGERLQSVPDQLDALRLRMEELAAGPTPAAPPAAGGEASVPLDDLVEAVRSELTATSATIGSEVQAIVSRLAEEESKRTDQLALKVTNMSMSLQQSLETLRDRADAMSRRATTIESENAAILEAVRTEVGRIATAVGEQIQRVTAEVDRVAPAVAEHADLVRRSVDQLAPTVSEQLERVREELISAQQAIAAAIPGAPPDLTPILAALDEATARTGERLDATVGELGQAVDAIAPAVGDRLDASIGSGLERIGNTLDDRIGEMVNRLLVRLDAVEAAAGKLIVDVRRTLSEGTHATRQVLEEQIGALEERAEGITTLVDAAMEEIRGTSASTERALHEVGTRVGGVESAVGALPGREAAEQVTRELGQIASNLNEVWMRARAILQASEDLRGALDEQGAAVIDRVDAGVRRLDEAVARGGVTMADRVAEIEARMINALGKVELRDTTFTEVLMRLADRLPTRERSKLAERLLPWRRRADVRPPSPASDARRAEPPARAVAGAPTPRPATPTTKKVATTKAGAKKEATRQQPPPAKQKTPSKKKAAKSKASRKRKASRKKAPAKSNTAEKRETPAKTAPPAKKAPSPAPKPVAAPSPPERAPHADDATHPPGPEQPRPRS